MDGSLWSHRPRSHDSKVGDVKVIGFDEGEVTLQAIQDGEVVGTVVQDPFQYGYLSIKLLTGLQHGDRSVLPPSGYIDVPPRVITQENLESFWSSLKQQLAAE